MVLADNIWNIIGIIFDMLYSIQIFPGLSLFQSFQYVFYGWVLGLVIRKWFGVNG